MGYKENRKREAERWGDEANRWVGRRSAVQKANTRLFGTHPTKAIWDENGDLITVDRPQYLQDLNGNRAFKITEDLLNIVKTRWLINPQPQDFKVCGMVYWADQIAQNHKRRQLFMADGLIISIICIHLKRGLWKVYIRKES